MISALDQREGFPALEKLLANTSQSPEPELRYRLIDASELRLLPLMAWRIRHVLPTSGLAAVFGSRALFRRPISASG